MAPSLHPTYWKLRIVIRSQHVYSGVPACPSVRYADTPSQVNMRKHYLCYTIYIKVIRSFDTKIFWNRWKACNTNCPLHPTSAVSLLPRFISGRHTAAMMVHHPFYHSHMESVKGSECAEIPILTRWFYSFF